MFLGLSLTAWLVIVGVFVLVTPIVGKQVAKDALKVKDSLQSGVNRTTSFVLFPDEFLSNLDEVKSTAPVQSFTEKKYIRQMMMGGVWMKFLFNIVEVFIPPLAVTLGLIVYSIGTFFRGIFSTK